MGNDKNWDYGPEGRNPQKPEDYNSQQKWEKDNDTHAHATENSQNSPEDGRDQNIVPDPKSYDPNGDMGRNLDKDQNRNKKDDSNPGNTMESNDSYKDKSPDDFDEENMDRGRDVNDMEDMDDMENINDMEDTGKKDINQTPRP